MLETTPDYLESQTETIQSREWEGGGARERRRNRKREVSWREREE